MKPNRVTGPLLALALICAPAIPALAQPVSTHVVEFDWSSAGGGTWSNGGVTVTYEGSGQIHFSLLVVETTIVACEGGSAGTLSRNVSHNGPIVAASTIDRHMDEFSLVGPAVVSETTSLTCPGAAAVSGVQQVSANVDLHAVAIDRPVRTRDRDSGTRYIVRPANVTVSLDGAVYGDQGLMTEAISRG